MHPRLRLVTAAAAFAAAVLLVASATDAQPGGKKGGKGSTETADEFVKKVMAFNKAGDGKLTREELIDRRLHDLFDRADAKKNGYVTRADLEALYDREKLEGGFGKKGKGGPGDKKGKGGDKKGPPPDA